MITARLTISCTSIEEDALVSEDKFMLMNYDKGTQMYELIGLCITKPEVESTYVDNSKHVISPPNTIDLMNVKSLYLHTSYISNTCGTTAETSSVFYMVTPGPEDRFGNYINHEVSTDITVPFVSPVDLSEMWFKLTDENDKAVPFLNNPQHPFFLCLEVSYYAKPYN
jgi:hypothetical protein